MLEVIKQDFFLSYYRFPCGFYLVHWPQLNILTSMTYKRLTYLLSKQVSWRVQIFSAQKILNKESTKSFWFNHVLMPYFLHIIEYDSLSCYLLVIFKSVLPKNVVCTTKVQFITKKVQLVVAFFRLIIIDRAAVKRVSWSQIWRKWWPLNDLAGWSVFNTSKSNFDNILAVSSSCQMMKGVWFSKTFAILKYLSTKCPLLCPTVIILPAIYCFAFHPTTSKCSGGWPKTFFFFWNVENFWGCLKIKLCFSNFFLH